MHVQTCVRPGLRASFYTGAASAHLSEQPLELGEVVTVLGLHILLPLRAGLEPAKAQWILRRLRSAQAREPEYTVARIRIWVL
jgi:hypothetical protein